MLADRDARVVDAEHRHGRSRSGMTSRAKTSSIVSARRTISASAPLTSTIAGRGSALKLAAQRVLVGARVEERQRVAGLDARAGAPAARARRSRTSSRRRRRGSAGGLAHARRRRRRGSGSARRAGRAGTSRSCRSRPSATASGSGCCLRLTTRVRWMPVSAWSARPGSTSSATPASGTRPASPSRRPLASASTTSSSAGARGCADVAAVHPRVRIARRRRSRRRGRSRAAASRPTPPTSSATVSPALAAYARHVARSLRCRPRCDMRPRTSSSGAADAPRGRPRSARSVGMPGLYSCAVA